MRARLVSGRSGAPRGGRGFAWFALVSGGGHLALTALSGRLRAEHVLADALLMVLPWMGGRADEFARGAFPAWIFGVLYDNQRLFLALRGRVHNADLASLELAWVPAPGGASWPQWFQTRTSAVLDLLSGFAYATYLLEVGVAALALFALRSARFRALGWSFLAAGALGIAGYVLYPAAPPWYMEAFGAGQVNLAAAPSAAGALRFDALLGVDFFASFYARNPNIFGAMPSLHAAFPVLVAWHVWDRGWRWRALSLAYAALVWFAAVYLNHHWVLDVVAGIAVALAASGLVAVALRLSTAGAATAHPVPVAARVDREGEP
ncbi:MAG: inositol phosphorylceramide synthase [Deltaproteobacteria bacterium]|nr:inositol phosphorylceramide synthase [Deltaproteobacteria bacterium]